MGLTWRWVTTLEEFVALAPAWDAALAEVAGDNPFLQSEFLLTWCQAFLPPRGLRVLALSRNGRLAGGLPLYRAQRAPGVPVLRLVGCGFANWTEPFFAGDRCEFAAACSRALEGLRGWRYLSLPLARAPLGVSLPETAPMVTRDASLCFEPGWRTMDDYLATRSPRLRAHLRRSLRLAEAAGGVELRRETDPAVVAELIAFQLRHNGPDRYPPDRVVSGSRAAWSAFTRELLLRLLSRGQLDAMALRIGGPHGGELAAAGFGFRSGPGYKSMLISHDPKFRRLGPGDLFFFHLIAWCLRHAEPELNMFALTPEKRRWCNSYAPLHHVRVFPNTLAGRLVARHLALVRRFQSK